MQNKVTLKETIELFVISTYREIKAESEIPNFNIIFPEDAYKLFQYVMDNPHKKKGYLTPNIRPEYIENMKQENNQNPNVPTMTIKNASIFFKYLTDITNNLVELYRQYGELKDARALHIQAMRRIWLRMGNDDFNNVEEFLDLQLQFIKNQKLDEFKKEITVDHILNYDVVLKTRINSTWDETPRNISFKIVDKEQNTMYELPHIHYAISEDNTCYIYAIQNEFEPIKNKKIVRELYKLNKGIENPCNHPDQVYSMILFLRFLKEQNISKIKIPTNQTLSYRYHKLLSEYHKQELINLGLIGPLKRKLTNEITKEDKKRLERYEKFLLWCDNIIDKEDVIEQLKTTNFINLIKRMPNHIPDLEIKELNNDMITLITIRTKQKKKR